MRVGPVIVALTAALALAGCQSLPMPTPSPTPTAVNDGGSSSGSTSPPDVDVSAVEGESPADGLVDPCSLLSVEEVQAATGVAVLGVVRGAVQNDGSQICAFAMDATGSTAAALAGTPGLPSGGLGDVVNTMKAGGAVIGVILSAQDPDDDYSATDDSGDAPPPEIQVTPLTLGKGGAVVATPNGGAAFVANDYNVVLTIMDLIAGPASTEALTSLVEAAYSRL